MSVHALNDDLGLVLLRRVRGAEYKIHPPFLGNVDLSEVLADNGLISLIRAADSVNGFRIYKPRLASAS